MHVVAMPVDHAHLDALHALHDAEDRHDHEERTHEEGRPEEPAPRGLLIELPHVLAARPRGATSSSATSLAPIVALPSPSLRPAPVEGPLRPEDPRSAWPSRRAKRSGVAALLRSSHAILI